MNYSYLDAQSVDELVYRTVLGDPGKYISDLKSSKYWLHRIELEYKISNSIYIKEFNGILPAIDIFVKIYTLLGGTTYGSEDYQTNDHKLVRDAAIKGNASLVRYFLDLGLGDLEDAVFGSAVGGLSEEIKIYRERGVLENLGKLDQKVINSAYNNIILRGLANGGHLNKIIVFITNNEVLLKHGIDGAVSGKQFRMIDYFINKGVPANEGMMEAGEQGSFQLVKYLISKGASDLFDVLEGAIRANNTDFIISFLNEYKILVDITRLTTLLEGYVGKANYLAIEKILLTIGQDIPISTLNELVDIAFKMRNINVVNSIRKSIKTR
jgi:hypothetical protein